MAQMRVSWHVLILATAVAFVSSGCKKAPPPRKVAAVPVIAAEALKRTTTNYLERIAELRGAQDVEIRARVAGIIKTIDFSEGRTVSSNALLYTLDDQPFKARVDQAAAVSSQMEALWDRARRDTNRLGPLWVKRAISGQQYDDSLANERAAAANYLAAQAAQENAQIDLAYTKIYAPLSGIVGKTEVSAGNLVGQGQPTLLTTISKIDPIHARFSANEQLYMEWRRHTLTKGTQQGAPKGVFELITADGALHPHKGDLVFGDREVDPKTGTFLLQVAFPNPDLLLRPGQFARVRFPFEILPEALLIPQRAVQELQATYSVYVVNAESKAEFRRVTLGPRIGTFYVIHSGLKDGEQVVIDGIQKIQNGVPLMVTSTNLVSELSPAAPLAAK